MQGLIFDVQRFSVHDGPGIRTTVFMKGCPLRCGCCHNPDTWDPAGGKEWTAEDVLKKALRFREYFGEEGGITLSGGEPLMQASFAAELFRQSREAGLNTCLDTSGCVLNGGVEELLSVTDRVLLDLKYVTEEKYRAHVGCGLAAPLKFLARLNELGKPVTLRQVTIPGLNDDEASVRELVRIAEAHPCVDKVELLPFRKICQVKYDNLGIKFPYGDLPEPSREKMKLLEDKILNDATVMSGSVLKVDAFLGQKIDVCLANEMAKEWKRRFADKEINKILTIEASGIALAVLTAEKLLNPQIFRLKYLGMTARKIFGFTAFSARENCEHLKKEIF